MSMLNTKKLKDIVLCITSKKQTSSKIFLLRLKLIPSDVYLKITLSGVCRKGQKTKEDILKLESYEVSVKSLESNFNFKRNDSI